MKQYLWAFLVLSIALPASAQHLAPRVSFETTVKDFGKVTEGELLKYTFRFSNVGTAPLEMKLEPLCGCATAELSDRRVEAGRVGKVDITVNTEGITTL